MAYTYESIQTASDWRYLGTLITGMFYAFPMTIITLFIAIANYKTSGKYKKNYARIVIITVIFVWIIYYICAFYGHVLDGDRSIMGN